MNYLIHFAQSFKNPDHRKLVKEIVDSQARRLSGIGDRHFRSAVTDLYFDNESGNVLKILAVVNLNGEILYLKEQGTRLDRIVLSLFDRLKLLLTRRFQADRLDTIRRERAVQVRSLQEHLDDLKDLKEADQSQVFNKILKIILNDVANYIKRRLKSAELTTAVKRGRFKVQELLNELYLMVYEDLDELPAEDPDITPWLFRKADVMLAEKLMELEFEKERFSEYEQLVEAEFRSLEESFTIDGEEEIIPLEELEEYHDQVFPDWYMADDLIYGEEETTLLEELNVSLGQGEIHRHIEKELAKLPLRERTIMDLYLAGQMSAKEIAGIRGISPREAEKIVSKVNSRLKESLSNLMKEG